MIPAFCSAFFDVFLLFLIPIVTVLNFDQMSQLLLLTDKSVLHIDLDQLTQLAGRRRGAAARPLPDSSGRDGVRAFICCGLR